MTYELAIIGGGPAAVSAGVYASRKKLKTIFITKDWGGQSNVSDGIENWIGTIKLSGKELADSLENHLKAYAGDVVDIKEGVCAEKIEKDGDIFKIQTDDGQFESKTILISTGSQRRKLEVLGADKFEHKGVTYCATCDGPLFTDKDVAVVGGGNSALESVAQLSAYTKSVTLIHRRNEFRADPVTVQKVLEHPKVKTIKNVELVEIQGDQFVSGLKYKDNETNDISELKIDGIFVEIGAIPSTNLVKDLVELNDTGAVVVDPKNQRASIAGVWAAGDCTDGLYHQNNIASGDAVKALEDIYNYLNTR